MPESGAVVVRHASCTSVLAGSPVGNLSFLSLANTYRFEAAALSYKVHLLFIPTSS